MSTSTLDVWPARASLANPECSPIVVIDTNVVLDWLVFRNPACVVIESALASQSIRWFTTAAMQDELRWVLTPALCERWQSGAAAVIERVATLSLNVSAPLQPGPLRCSDVDDQIFIDLALAQGARWLLTRDRALLKLDRRARLLGVEICPPVGWTGPAR